MIQIESCKVGAGGCWSLDVITMIFGGDTARLLLLDSERTGPYGLYA